MNMKAFQIAAMTLVVSLGACQKIIKLNDGALRDDDPEAAANQFPIGTKDFAQINNTMSTLTGIPMSDVQNTYNSVKDAMPASSDPKSFNASMQVAIGKLGAEYCNRLLNDGTRRAAFYPNFNFGANPAAAFANAQTKREVVEQTLSKFWGEGVGDWNSAEATLIDLIDESVQRASANTPNSGDLRNNAGGTATVLKAVCIATITALPVTMF